MHVKKVVLGVCSSISIYKACEIVRLFQKNSIQVQVIMTKNATKLISPLLFSSLTGRKTVVDPFQGEFQERIEHVSLAKEISLFLVAPATANIIGKFANGIADDFMSTFYMAIECPVLIAPAMNDAMFWHKQTQNNIQKLKDFGVNFVDPEKGYLACGDEGWGRLAAPEKIVEQGLFLMSKSLSLKGKTVLVTAGPTREYMDPVRFLSNLSSGKMGYAIADEAMRRGAKVYLVSGPTHLTVPKGTEIIKVETAEEMEKEVLKRFDLVDIVVMAAAVSDFKFSKPASKKIKKSGAPKSMSIIQTPDVLKKLGERKGKKILIGFAAETDNVVQNALDKIKQKNLDLIIANEASKAGIGFESDFNQVTIIYPDGKTVCTKKQTKDAISRIILDKIEEIVGQKNRKSIT
ncbi:MAG: bifunctional phosphopantothenoylcysteine decarboxylase/phosphopantothenate--cysteine ligase CoaBC [Candidatus Aminicenantes bacterium]|nr:bifunctional phosphopantothenoylcysteine decarboxylase/phosphopantothenate--cysteine ligase CoaBC [Candidatus Aminicenantes bacterium]